MATMTLDFNAEILEAELKLKEAKLKQLYFDWLCSKDIAKTDAFRLASNLDFDRVLKSKEFTTEEKQELEGRIASLNLPKKN